MPTVAEKRRTFRRLHETGCFVLPNPWDLGSAAAVVPPLIAPHEACERLTRSAAQGGGQRKVARGCGRECPEDGTMGMRMTRSGRAHRARARAGEHADKAPIPLDSISLLAG